jgi:hypothetical protein
MIGEAGATGNKVQGNYVGTNAAGAAAVPNHFNGVMVFQGASNNLIGGASLGMGNVVSGNTNAGIRIETAGTTGNVIQGNLVGVAADGVTALGNTPGDESGWGVFVADADNNTVGGIAPGESNVVAYNSGPGVAINGNTATSNAIRANRIFANGGLGIDLGSDGVTQNDSQDTDVGPNNLQNFPVLSAASRSATNTQIQGTINSIANSQFQLDFFASDVADATGYGEGKQYLGTTTVTTNGSGDASFNVTLPVSVPVGSMLTATATDAGNNTSEFSQAILAVNASTPSVTLSVSPATLAEAGGTSTVTATLSAVSGLGVTVALAFSGTATNVTDYTRSGTQIVIPAESTTGTVTLTAVADTLVEGNETVIVDISGVTNGTESGTQ